ncbi:MAG TPA: sulfatase-like hydrolase/transferase [Mycobacteriales bacterium]|jgi:arylsulfatase A-like enzyme|nr:sulfatase-like hydrolase/transferase [Mycobacteriales bacterium]
MPEAVDRTRPNVILIVSDDHGYADRSALGIDPEVRTPALDRLAAEGVSCDTAYVSAPICSPSRSGIISGRYQQRWGGRWFDTSSFPTDGVTMAERFTELGYATGYFGKVHYGQEKAGDRACPDNHGFAESLYGLAGLSMGRLHYQHHSRAAAERYGAEGTRVHGVSPLFEDGNEADCEGFLTAELGERARDFTTRHRDEPFFAMVAFNAVHNFCWQLPKEELDRRGLAEHPDWDADTSEYVDWYDGAISPNLPNGRDYYRAQLELMDAEIGKLLDQLDALGIADNTVIVYTTDNGGSTCNYGNNSPLAGTKYTLWEGGIRVPMIIRWAGGGISAGRHVDALVSSLDLYPTLLSAAGGVPRDCDGVNQLPLLTGRRNTGHSTLHWDCGFQWAVRDEEWKLAWVDPDSPIAAGIRKVEHADPGAGLRLHRIIDDISEQRELAEQHPEVVQRLTALHENWASSIAGQH